MHKLITILGPTAVGKTFLAAQLAYKFKGEIISADSRQVYKKLNIGTGKDYSDYIVNGTQIKYHLIDIIDPSEEYSLFKFQEDFYKTFEDINSRKKLPFLVGGTGLYLSCIIQEYKLNKADFKTNYAEELEQLSLKELQKKLLELNPSLHNTTDLLSKERAIRRIIVLMEKENGKEHNFPKLKHLIIGVIADRGMVIKRIETRLKERLQNGMIEEIKSLLDKGCSPERLISLGLEYKFLTQYALGELNYNDMHQKLRSAIVAFSKRQMGWYHKMERMGVKINWIHKGDIYKAEELISEFLHE
ncbi:MAG: tRNA (adenosine(37)-N6)-dimethylallyltransferase MiaA [Syntrophothermus sp.]